MPKVTPEYYLDFLTWAWKTQAEMAHSERVLFLTDVWTVFREIVEGIAPAITGLTLGKAIRLGFSRWDPLDRPRDLMEKMRKTYGREA